MKKYRLAFYEGGKFSHFIGASHSTKAAAAVAFEEICDGLRDLFEISIEGRDSLPYMTYNRYGTVCAVCIEESEEK